MQQLNLSPEPCSFFKFSAQSTQNLCIHFESNNSSISIMHMVHSASSTSVAKASGRLALVSNDRPSVSSKVNSLSSGTAIDL